MSVTFGWLELITDRINAGQWLNQAVCSPQAIVAGACDLFSHSGRARRGYPFALSGTGLGGGKKGKLPL